MAEELRGTYGSLKMRNLPGIVSRLNRRQLAAVLVAVVGLTVIVLGVSMHSAVLPDLFPRGGTQNLQTDGVVADEPAPIVPVAGPVELGSDGATSPVGGLANPTPSPRPDGQTTPTRPRPSPTTTTTAPPPPPTTTSTTLPTLLPGIPIGGPPVGSG